MADINIDPAVVKRGLAALLNNENLRRNARAHILAEQVQAENMADFRRRYSGATTASEDRLDVIELDGRRVVADSLDVAVYGNGLRYLNAARLRHAANAGRILEAAGIRDVAQQNQIFEDYLRTIRPIYERSQPTRTSQNAPDSSESPVLAAVRNIPMLPGSETVLS